jgi:hypothetical protein
MGLTKPCETEAAIRQGVEEIVEQDREARKRLRDVARRAASRGRVDRVAEIATELYKPVEEWDWEELTRGRPRTRDGRFDAATPSWLTPVVQREIERRLGVVGKQKLAEHLDVAIQTFAKLLTDDERDDRGRPLVPPAVRLQAASFIYEHLVGKATTRVEVEAHTDEVFFRLAGAMVVDGTPAHPVAIGDRDDDEREAPEGDDPATIAHDVTS